MNLEEAKNIIAAQSHYKRWENIVDEFHGTDDYSEYLEKAAKLCIASLESQLRDKERVISEYRTMLSPMWEWAENNDSFKLGESITKRILEMAKSSVEKDKEIEAFKDIENIRSQATKSVCEENYELRDEIERLKIDLEAYKLSNEIHRKLI